MFIESARLYQIRNLADQKIEFHPRNNIIFGANGQGKTNLIEALSFVSNGKSFRTQSFKQIPRWSEREASVFALVQHRHASFEIGIAIKDGKKKAFYNGEEVSSFSDYLGKLICVSFSPTDLELIKGAPGERRRFLDRHIIDLRPSLVNDYVTYSRALKNKNKILSGGSASSQLLESWNRVLSSAGLNIHLARAAFISDLEQKVKKIHPRFAKADGELSLQLIGSLCAIQGELNQDAVFSAFMSQAGREISAGSSKFGPHRDDLSVQIGAQDSRAFASQGQARSLVLSLKLGVIELIEESLGESPVVLLDDVNSELDRERSHAFFEMIMSHSRQIFISGTDSEIAALSEADKCCVMKVEAGKVSKIP